MRDDLPPAQSPARLPAWERALALALRSAHLAAVVWLGGALLGAPIARAGPAWAVLATGALLLVQDLAARRIDLREAAGWVVLLKLAGAGLIAVWPAVGAAAFWALVVLSALSSHAPKAWRHWRPRAARPSQQRASNAGRPG